MVTINTDNVIQYDPEYEDIIWKYIDSTYELMLQSYETDPMTLEAKGARDCVKDFINKATICDCLEGVLCRAKNSPYNDEYTQTFRTARYEMLCAFQKCIIDHAVTLPYREDERYLDYMVTNSDISLSWYLNTSAEELNKLPQVDKRYLISNTVRTILESEESDTTKFSKWYVLLDVITKTLHIKEDEIKAAAKNFLSSIKKTVNK